MKEEMKILGNSKERKRRNAEEKFRDWVCKKHMQNNFLREYPQADFLSRDIKSVSELYGHMPYPHLHYTNN
jgi:hypothetical protein